MRRLLTKLSDFAETIDSLVPAQANYFPKPSTELVQAAAAMLETPNVVFESTSDPNLVRVFEVTTELAHTEGTEDECVAAMHDASLDTGTCESTQPSRAVERTEEEFAAAVQGGDGPRNAGTFESTQPSLAMNLFLDLTSCATSNDICDSDESHDSEDDAARNVVEDIEFSNEDDALLQSRIQKTEELEEEKLQEQKTLYQLAARWSLRRAHRIEIPVDGWLVDLKLKICGCRYFDKFLVCAHLVAAQQKYNHISWCKDPLENRIVGKVQSKRTISKQRTTTTKKVYTRAHSKSGLVTQTTRLRGNGGRLPAASGAMTLQDVVQE